MADKKQTLRRYIIMSSTGYAGGSLDAASLKPSANMVTVKARPQAVTPAPQMRVLAELHGGASKLVEMPAEGELSLRLSDPGLKIVPEVIYHRQWQRFRIHRRPVKTKAQAAKAKTAKGKAKAAGAAFSTSATMAL